MLNEWRKMEVADEKELLEKIQGILASEEMTDAVKIVNIRSVVIERYKYCMKPWYLA